MNKTDLIALMLTMLQDALDAHRVDEGTDANPVKASPDLPLIGEEAAITSMGLVSFVSDIESTLQERLSVELTLVSEQALSRRHSPFRTIDALSDYVLELLGTPATPMATSAA